ncbi:MAG TPA: YfhO family protein, partial [Acidimicrobiales bacterium]|nr:YfhO family protein [Acidimicrobiales bacterium]
HGHLPLWNPYSALGTPLAFNFQSAVFSVPALIGYLFPMHLAYTVQVLCALAIAGSGTYVLGRVLGLGVLGSAVAATVFELSGPLVGWLGWPLGWVTAWAGWLFACTVLVLRARHRRRAVVGLAVVVACMVYAGQPEGLILFAAALAVFVVVSLVLRSPALGGSGPVRAPVVDLVCAGAGGFALAAPLLLPGLQLAGHAVRSGKHPARGLPAHELVGFVLQGFDGLPISGSRWFGSLPYYLHEPAYVGVVGLVLAALGTAVALRGRRRNADRAGFVAVAVVAVALCFVGFVTAVADAVPTVDGVKWERSLLVAGFALAVLAGIGADTVVRHWDKAMVRRWTTGGFAVGAVLLAVLWFFARGRLPAFDASLRARSFLYPTLGTAAGMGLVLLARLRRRADRPIRGRSGGPWLAMCLLAVETVLLVAAGAPLESSSPVPLAPTAAETQLAGVVGGSLVALGADSCFTAGQLGIVPNVNVPFGLDELAIYDPFLPRAYYTSWRQATGTTGGPVPSPGVPFSVFCPAVTSLAVAQRYGVGYILEPSGAPGPAGTVRVGTVGGEGFYRVPGSARATLVPLTDSVTSAASSLDASGRPVPVSYPGPASWRVETDSSAPSLLRLRLTDVPGWQATVDGRPVHLTSFARVMLQMKLPPGRHVVVLHYEPLSFRLGVVLALVALVILAGALLLPAGRRRLQHQGANAVGKAALPHAVPQS